MIVQPTPTNPRSPLRRALRLGGLVLPVALLAVVSGAGILGTRPEPPPARPPAGEATPASPDAPQFTASSLSPGPVALVAADGPPPTQFGDLPATTPGELIAARDRGRSPAAVAVSGYLQVIPGAGCAARPGGPVGPWCVRTGILADWWWTSMSTLTGPVPPHIHLVVPVGVRLPEAVARTVDSTGGGGAHVLVVGRFDDASPCTASGRSCGDDFVVERFAWVDGVRVGLTPLVADRLDTGDCRPSPFTLALDDADMPLSAVLVWPAGVKDLDPAAAALAATGPSSEPVWYLRVLDGARGPGMERRVRWMLLSEKDLRVLGSGRPIGHAAGSSGTGAG